MTVLEEFSTAGYVVRLEDSHEGLVVLLEKGNEDHTVWREAVWPQQAIAIGQCLMQAGLLGHALEDREEPDVDDLVDQVHELRDQVRTLASRAEEADQELAQELNRERNRVSRLAAYAQGYIGQDELMKELKLLRQRADAPKGDAP